MNRIKRFVSTKTTNLHDPIRYKSWNISCGRPYVSMNMYIGFYWSLDTSVRFDLFWVSVNVIFREKKFWSLIKIGFSFLNEPECELLL